MSASALTTVFTPPASCSNNQYTPVGGSIFVKDTQIASSECYPTGFHALFTQAIPYSPGVCPSGYNAATPTAYSNDATAALCCPTSWQAYGGLGCHSSLTSPSVLDLPSGSITAPSGVYLAVHGVYVAWASSDLGSFTPASPSPLSDPSAPVVQSSTTPSITSSATSSVPSSVTTSPTTTVPSVPSSRTVSATASSRGETSPSQRPSSTSSASVSLVSATVFVTPVSPAPTHKSLSMGDQAAVGVGASVGGLALISLGLLAFIRRRRRLRQAQPNFQTVDEKAELPEHSKRIIPELESAAIAAELEGSPPMADDLPERC